MLIAHGADVVIGVDGSYGTVSEAAIALKLGKPVIALQVAWDLPGLQRAATAAEAVAGVGTGLMSADTSRGLFIAGDSTGTAATFADGWAQALNNMNIKQILELVMALFRLENKA